MRQLRLKIAIFFPALLSFTCPTCYWDLGRYLLRKNKKNKKNAQGKCKVNGKRGLLFVFSPFVGCFLDESGPTWFPDSDWTKFTGSAPPSIQYVSWFISRMPDPDFYPSRISNPGSRIQKQQQKRGVKKNCYHTFLWSQILQNWILFYFWNAEKKIWANFQRIIEVFTQKVLTMHWKIWVWDPRSGIRKKPIPDPGVKKAPDPGPRIRIRNTVIYVSCCRAWCAAWICLRGRITFPWFMSTASPRQTIPPWTSNPGSAATEPEFVNL